VKISCYTENLWKNKWQTPPCEAYYFPNRWFCSDSEPALTSAGSSPDFRAHRPAVSQKRSVTMRTGWMGDYRKCFRPIQIGRTTAGRRQRFRRQITGSPFTSNGGGQGHKRTGGYYRSCYGHALRRLLFEKWWLWFSGTLVPKLASLASVLPKVV